MPDILLSNYKLPDRGNEGTLPAYNANYNDTTIDPYLLAYSKVAKAQKQDNINALMNLPVETPINQVLKYTDPNIGFNPFDSKLEYKYADAHPVKTFRNNLIQGGARFLGAGAEAIATIPLAINALANKDFSKLYNNEFTNPITEWLDGLQYSLPTYQTEYEANHPLLKYLTPWNVNSFAGAWSGAVNNLGYTAGAIAGALVEDAVLTYLTGGTALLPAAGLQARNLLKGLSRGSKIAVEAPLEAAQAARATYRLGEAAQAGAQTGRIAGEIGQEVAQTGRVAGEVATLEGAGLPAIAAESRGVARAEGTGMFQSAGRTEQLLGENAYKARMDKWDTYYKIRNSVKYNLALLTSAAAEGAFESSDVYRRGRTELMDQFREIYGRSAQGSELSDIEQQAKEAANFTMGANIALLYVSNRINWGSMFKPTGSALREFEGGITGWGKNIARTSAKAELVDVENAATKQLTKEIAYKLVSKSPETRLGKVLLNAEKVGKVGFRSINESIEEGSQFIISEGSTDYVKRKYNPNNIKQVGDFMKSFNVGVGKTFGTNEGWDNIIGGFIGGLLGGAAMSKIQKQTPLKTRLENQVKMLNSQKFNGTFENKFTEATTQFSLGEEHKKNVEAGDIFKAKNTKFEMLYNWVSSGVRANSFEKRMYELDMVRDLEGKSFQSYWGMEDTKQNREQVNAYLDSVKQKAENIRGHVEQVERLTRNPHTPGTDDYRAYENYKDALSLNLSKYDEYQRRIKAVKNDLTAIAPMLNIDDAVKLTSVQGMSETLQKLNKVSLDLTERIKQSEGNKELQDSFIEKRKAIDNLFSRLQSIVYSGTTKEGGRTVNVDFKGKEFVSVMHDLYDLYNGIDLENNKYIDKQKALSDGNTIHLEAKETYTSDDQLADVFEKLQDIYKLSDANYNIGKYYTYLRKGLGMSKFISDFKKMMEENAQFVDREGNIKTPQDVESEIRENEYFNIIKDENDEDTTAQEREVLKRAAKKVVEEEPLTEEEQKLTEDKENIFSKFVKVEQKVKDSVDKVLSGIVDAEIKPKDTVKAATNKYGNIEPRSLFGMFSQDKNDVKFRTNLYNAIFKSGKNGILGRLNASFNFIELPNGKTTYSKIPGTNIYRSSFTENITISHNGNDIGILRPADSLWLDSVGKRSIYDMNEEEYEQITGNSKDTYNLFMTELKSYKDAYNGLKEEMNSDKEKSFQYETLNKYFNISINIGSRVQNSIDESSKDTLLKNLKYKPSGTALISFTEVITTDTEGNQISQKTKTPQIVNKNELSFNQRSKVEMFIRNNIDFLSQNSNRYILLLPVNEEYILGGVVFGRNADTIADEKNEYYSAVRKVADGSIRDEEQTKLIGSLNNKFFLANQNREVKQTFINTSFDNDGNLVIKISNPTNKVFKNITVSKSDVLNTNNYDELMQKVQSEITNESSKDKGLKGLAILLNENSLKRQIPADTKAITLKELEDVIKLNTIPDVFVNYNLNFTPKSAEQLKGKSVKETEVKEEPTVTEPKKTGEVTYVKNKKELTDLLKKLFNLTQEQADSVATIFELNSKAWAKRTGKEAKEFYKTLGFSDMLEAMTSQEDILFSQFNYTSNKLLREVFPDIEQYERIGYGSDRDVYDLGDGRVVKVAKTARGLAQNKTEADPKLLATGILPEVYESGLNYNIVEKVDNYSEKITPSSKELEINRKIDALTKDLFRAESEFNSQSLDMDEFKPLNEYLTAVLNKYNINPDILNFSMLGGDFKNSANWGVKNGQLYHLDGGTFKGDLIDQYKGKKDLDDKDFRDIYNRSEKLKQSLNINTDLDYQVKTDVEKVIDGFNLKPVYMSKIFVGFNTIKEGKAGIKLRDAINKWTKSVGIGVEAYIPYSGGNIFLRKTENKDLLKQSSGLEYNFQFENETEQIYDVVKDGRSLGTGSIEKLPGNKAKVSFFKNTSEIKGVGLQIFKDLTSKIIKEGYTPTIDRYITGYGYKAYEKLAKEGYLVKNNVAQINPEDSPSKQQDYGTNIPFSYSEKTLKENEKNIKKYLQDNNFIDYICK